MKVLGYFVLKVHAKVNKKEVAGASLMGHSKAFDCIEHELLIAKIDVHGISKKAQLIICNFISGRKQRVN